jgi:protocatechuate 3,4-dioxygenase alpha subunit
MTQPLDILQETPSQTAGPFVHIGCIPTFTGITSIYPEDLGQRAIEDGVSGELITIKGSIFDGTGWALRDAMIETWQPDAQGKFPGQAGCDPKLNGFCRFAADATTGEFTFKTVKPGPVPTRDARLQSAHIPAWIVARGINIGLHTRIYFEDEYNDDDPLLARIEQRPRVETLLAKKEAPGAYRFDIRLQGVDETVFLDL